MTEDQLNTILSMGKDKLMSLVPKGAHMSNYVEIRKANWEYYNMILSLNGCITNSRKRAQKFGWEFDLTLPQVVAVWIEQKGLCYDSGLILDYQSGTPSQKNPRKVSIDREENNRGYVMDNIRLVTHWNNNAKSTYDEVTNNMFISETYKFKNKSST